MWYCSINVSFLFTPYVVVFRTSAVAQFPPLLLFLELLLRLCGERIKFLAIKFLRDYSSKLWTLNNDVVSVQVHQQMHHLLSGC